MNKKFKFAMISLLAVGAVAGTALLLRGSNIAVLNPKGPVAQKELDLMITATLLMLIVAIPVFVLAFGIAWKFRAGNKQAEYLPEWDHSRVAETVWWGIPLLLIFVLSLITWSSSHELDPSRPLASSKPPLTIQVVALQWKWLFIYPEQHIATVNSIIFPVDTPINFVITSDAPMNSFWIPQLGGQIYAMSGMSTRLNLMATSAGSYDGSSANLSGEGFSGMKFSATAVDQAHFDAWVSAVQGSLGTLDSAEYAKLALPSQDNDVVGYGSAQADLYDRVVMKYMTP